MLSHTRIYTAAPLTPIVRKGFYGTQQQTCDLHATMPVFQERASRDRDLRIHPTKEQPLPRLTPPPSRAKSTTGDEALEVVVIGVRDSTKEVRMCIHSFIVWN
jgi:hypothetical protein